MTFSLAMMGAPYTVDFIGTLDADGCAAATLWLPGHIPMFDKLLSHFAWCSASPFDFVSNPVELMFDPWAGGGGAGYVYDDGTSENALGWTAGGESVWVHQFDAGVGDTITKVASTFGTSTATNGPPNGDPCWIYVWDDLNNDGDPVDAVLLAQGSGTVANTNTNVFNEYDLDTPAPVIGRFFVGCHVWQDVGVYAAPMDESTPYGGEAWFMGQAVFDPHDLGTTLRYELGSIGFPAYWLLRADND
jgi:hypothetical protein